MSGLGGWGRLESDLRLGLGMLDLGGKGSEVGGLWVRGEGLEVGVGY